MRERERERWRESEGEREWVASSFPVTLLPLFLSQAAILGPANNAMPEEGTPQ